MTSSAQLPKLFVLPKDCSSNSQIISLNNPRTGKLANYYFSPDTGVYEFTKISAPQASPSSWLLAPSIDSIGTSTSSKATYSLELVVTCSSEAPQHGASLSKGYISRSSDLFIATPVDPLFLILPALCPTFNSDHSSNKSYYISVDDHFDNMITLAEDFQKIICNELTRLSIESRMESVCDSVDAGNQKMLRLNEELLFKELMRKATTMAQLGLPASFEERFVSKALEAPLQTADIEVANKDQPAISEENSQGLTTNSPTETASSELTATMTTADSTLTCPLAAPSSPPDDIVQLLRLRTAFTYLAANYLPSHLIIAMNSLLKSPSSPNFVTLDEHLAKLATLRSQNYASFSALEFSNKRSFAQDDEAMEGRLEKKRKKEIEEKRKKAGESKGVRDLKKVNVTGMKKMSDFFGAKGAKKSDDKIATRPKKGG
ncbi:MAG: hypothetical protein M1829_003233 [Trizodia sp. TS-e1964]|nr:MAG: hypothetical protein M1829_003233 [Trizodia sp. TS-e1964]